MVDPGIAGQPFRRINLKRVSTPLSSTDSLTAWVKMDSIQKLESSERRIVAAGINNQHAKTNLTVVKMNLEIERQRQQVEWHDSATLHLNEAVARMNQFILFRNNLFLPEKPDLEIKQFLKISMDNIEEAIQFLDKIDGSNATLIMGTWPERERIILLKNTLRKQEIFLSQYLTTPLKSRIALFYATDNAQ